MKSEVFVFLLTKNKKCLCDLQFSGIEMYFKDGRLNSLLIRVIISLGQRGERRTTHASKMKMSDLKTFVKQIQKPCLA